MLGIREIVVRPLLTEKSNSAFQDRNEYTFEVHPDATKPLIKQALKELFNVTVKDVRTMVVRRKSVTRGRTHGLTALRKKAIVVLKDGDVIPVFEG